MKLGYSRQALLAFASTSALFMNTQEAPWNDVRVRRALSMAIDRDAFVRLTTDLGGAPPPA